MIRTILIFTYFGLYLVLNNVFLPFWFFSLLLGMRKTRRKIMSFSARIWGRHFLAIAGANVIVEGAGNVPESDRVCFICNHQSVFDILILMAHSGKTPGFIAKKELIYIPVLNFWMLMLHCVFIDRRDIRKSARAIERGIKSLRRDNPMAIFPEGTRSRNGRVGEFKPGSLKLATRAGAIIVPVTLVNTGSLFEKTGRFKAETIRVIIHKPIPTESLSPEEKRGLTEKVRALIAGACPDTEKEEEVCAVSG
jgi:1-acyl-sn-glycerol-3-phosphate acyltransferase